MLNEPRGAALLTMERVAFDETEHPVEFGQHLYRASNTRSPPACRVRAGQYAKRARNQLGPRRFFLGSVVPADPVADLVAHPPFQRLGLGLDALAQGRKPDR